VDRRGVGGTVKKGGKIIEKYWREKKVVVIFCFVPCFSKTEASMVKYQTFRSKSIIKRKLGFSKILLLDSQ
jgi:hypothetical protein